MADVAQRAKARKTGSEPSHAVSRSTASGRSRSTGRGPHFAAGAALSLGGPIQTKPVIGKPGDRYEREADAVAQRVVSGQSAPPISSLAPGGLGGAQRMAEEEEPIQAMEEEEEPVQAMEEEEEPVQAMEEEEEPVQAMEEEEEPVQAMEEEEEPVQAMGAEEEEEPVQAMGAEEEEEPVQAMGAEEEEEPVQAMGAEEEEEPVQAMDETAEEPVQAMENETDDEPVQKQDDEATRDEPVQTAAEGGGAAPSMASAAAHAIDTRGAGSPLGSGVRSRLESSMGADLDHVRVHSDSAAQDSARALNARAFTHGNDIWLGSGESQNDLQLMAHEATHVVQQGAGVQRQVIQRTKKKKPAPVSDPKKVVKVKGKGTLDDTPGIKSITLPIIRIPPFKAELLSGPLELPKKVEGEERDTKQVREWEKEAGTADLETMVEDKFKTAKARITNNAGEPVYPFTLAGKSKGNVIGTKQQVKKTLLRPFWNEYGNFTSYHVDHLQEIQLGGEDETDNMWLLHNKPNISSGGLIRAEIQRRVEALTDVAGPKLWKKQKDYKKIRQQYTVTVLRVGKGKEAKAEYLGPLIWTMEEIQKGAPLEKLVPLRTDKALKQIGIVGSANIDKLTLFTSEVGRERFTVPWTKNTSQKKHEKDIGNFRSRLVKYNDTKGGKIFGDAFYDNKIVKKTALDFDINKFEWGGFGGYVNGHTVIKEARQKLKDTGTIKGLSPIDVQSAEFSLKHGISIYGQVLPTVPLFKDLRLDIEIKGNDVRISKTFSPSDFSFPGPIDVLHSSLTLSASTKGLKLEGEVGFEIQKVGQGKLIGRMGKKGLELEGAFDFDSKLFDPASVHVRYGEGQLSGGGKLGIKKGKVKGIKSAEVSALVEGDRWEASGTVKPDIKGVKEGNLDAKYDPKTGFELGGVLALSEEFPGIKGGSLAARVRPREGGEGYKVYAKGQADLDVPGISSSIEAEYDDGAFVAKSTIGYEKGLLKGDITFGVTNRPGESAEGEGGAPPKEDDYRAFGGGKVTVQVAPWLQGWIGLEVKPEGGIIASGGVELPDTVNLIDKKWSFKRPIFTTPSIDIPIIGVSAAGRRVGIFATIDGGLEAEANFGPVQLTDLGLGITYDPENEENTKVSGSAKLQIPADASLRLFVNGGIGAGIPIVDATAGLQVGAKLAFEGAAEAAVQVDWSPSQGLELNGTAGVYAQARFVVDLSAWAKVKLDLYLKTITLYSNRWKLAEKEFGSGLQVGAKLPFNYKQGQGFDLAWKDIELIKPEINPKALVSDLVADLI